MTTDEAFSLEEEALIHMYETGEIGYAQFLREMSDLERSFYGIEEDSR